MHVDLTSTGLYSEGRDAVVRYYTGQHGTESGEEGEGVSCTVYYCTTYVRG
jgi:hypothetical protein